MASVRLDKFLSQSGERTRSQSVRYIRDGQVSVNGNVEKDPSHKVCEDDEVLLNQQIVRDDSFLYVMLYKPAGVLTAATDKKARTVMDLLPSSYAHRNVMPVGRLDKDTTGVLLLTNDGTLAHRMLHPKHHVWKKYTAVVTGMLDEEDVRHFDKGMNLGDFISKPAELIILKTTPETSVAQVSVCEGKFHQVKRMFAACGHDVLTLHRDSFGPLTLPENMNPGDYKPLTKDEMKELLDAANR